MLSLCNDHHCLIWIWPKQTTWTRKRFLARAHAGCFVRANFAITFAHAMISVLLRTFPPPLLIVGHCVCVNEFLWQVVEADNALAAMTSMLDLQGLNIGVVRQTELIGIMKEFVKTVDAHFPQRCNKMLIVNAPKWFNVLFKIVSVLSQLLDARAHEFVGELRHQE